MHTLSYEQLVDIATRAYSVVLSNIDAANANLPKDKRLNEQAIKNTKDFSTDVMLAFIEAFTREINITTAEPVGYTQAG
jgi:hypothetical protein